MKYMIASDIHGSAFYCEKMIDRLKEEKPDRLILLGDLLYHGPRNDLPKDYCPKKVITMLNGISDGILCVRGNCEAEVDQMVLNFPCLADYAVLELNNRFIFATHGHIYNESNLAPLKWGDIMLNGHTHVPKFVKHDGYIYINPGSVSIPKEDSRHSYMIFENNSFIWKDTDGVEYKKEII